ncbi:MAG: single-stranded-DNA-specific exonuclease RecJ [Chloroflexi bacterium]|nr:single-stranded-DNA-specific exonuclease RecJ [Chloroflexota bacterium]
MPPARHTSDAMELFSPPRTWRVGPTVPEEELSEIGRVPAVVARILYNRGFRTEELVAGFLDPQFDTLADPFLMAGMEQAVGRIDRAIKNGELIAVYGDFDADGLTSSALLSQVLKSLGARVTVKIPNREDEGYGLNRLALQELARREGAKLVITVDCGISSREEIDFANSIGLDVIVTDHHLPLSERPAAVAVIDPRQSACRYPFKDLAGVGVAFTLVRGLARSGIWKVDFKAAQLLDLVSLGTVADVVPLLGENRILVKYGLVALNRTRRPGLQALMSQAGIKPGGVDSDSIGYALAPRLNAAGRISDARISFQLLTSETIEEAKALTQALEAKNTERQQLTERALSSAIQLVEQHGDRRLFLVAGKGWNAGVIGLVAGRLAEQFHRPVAVVRVDQDEFRGSARSIPGFDITKALGKCDDLLTRFGGHAQAAGFSGRSENIDALRERLCSVADSEITDEDLQPVLDIDAEVAAGDVTYENWRQLERLAPFGCGNPTPVFLMRDMPVASVSTMGSEQQHLRLQLYDEGLSRVVDAVGFRFGYWAQQLEKGQRVDAVFVMQVNDWNGRRSVRLNLKDLRLSEE